VSKYILIGIVVILYLRSFKPRREEDPIKKHVDQHLRAEARAMQIVRQQLLEEKSALAHTEEVDSLLDSLGYSASPWAEASELLSSLGYRVNPQARPKFRA